MLIQGTGSKAPCSYLSRLSPAPTKISVVMQPVRSASTKEAPALPPRYMKNSDGQDVPCVGVMPGTVLSAWLIVTRLPCSNQICPLPDHPATMFVPSNKTEPATCASRCRLNPRARERV